MSHIFGAIKQNHELGSEVLKLQMVAEFEKIS